MSDRIPAYALYIDPPLGRVGLSETEARKTGRPLLVSKRPMTRVGRAIEKGETKGFMKVVADAQTKQILGAGDRFPEPCRARDNGNNPSLRAGRRQDHAARD